MPPRHLNEDEEEEFLSELYQRLEEDARARYGAEHDLEAARERFASRLAKQVEADRSRAGEASHEPGQLVASQAGRASHPSVAANHQWGRVDLDGTVYVRTAEGERVIGSWQPGSPEEALAFFQRKYESLETEVALLEQRVTTTDLSPAQAQSSVERLRQTVEEAHALGDLDGLCERLDQLVGLVGHRREEVKAAREQARRSARDIKERIVAEAEQIAAEATHWKSSGERMRQLLEEWKTAPHAERAVEAALWERLSAARNVFTKRRKAYLAGLEEQRESIRIRKEKLVADAESLATSTAWGPTAGTFRDLMREWKAAGRAGREAEEDLWARFKAAQDQFFAARAEALSEKETGLREHAAAKQELLEQAASRIAAPPARLVPSEGIETLARLAGRLEGSDTALVVDAETARLLGVTSRTARRLLRGLVDEGFAWPLPPSRAAQPGRPRQFYRLITEKLDEMKPSRTP